ncbi:MAG: sporulation peptidase YabG [Peptococcaceae bacterium]|jgi:spore coat assembly protein|nr:sporulation peptidase YabG [Peptococcaceae bacterium]
MTQRPVKEGDIVARLSYGQDILFRVTSFHTTAKGEEAVLRGLDVRLIADAPISDLARQNPSEISQSRQNYIKKNSDLMRRIFERRVKDQSRAFMRGEADPRGKQPREEEPPDFFEMPGTVLHMDGDKDYLEICKATYNQLSIQANCVLVPEAQQPQTVARYIKEYAPDILVLTGHDGLLKDKKDFRDVGNYRSSRYFVDSVRKARELIPGRDDLIVVAGACQSHYEALIAAGANFASSPKRIMIHAFDPVFLAEKLAYTSIYDVLSIRDVLENTITGTDGVGGIETRGCLRLGYPRSAY